MLDAGRHPRIELLTYSEVEAVEGFVGNYRVRVRKRARYVDPDACTACAECEPVCPVLKADEFQQGFSSRHAIHIPFPQAVPASYIIRPEECLGANPIACGKCIDACERNAINFDRKDEVVTRDVGTIVVATGMDAYDPTAYDEYGYTRHLDVITSMEFERLICAGGPTEGHFIRPSDSVRPKRIAFIQCVGSRTGDPRRGNPYCSNICCMNTVKDVLLLADHYPDVESTVFYNDLRAYGKGFEDLLQRSRAAGTRYVRGFPSDVRRDPETGDLHIIAEDTATGKIQDYAFDLVVLSVGLVPRVENENLRKLLTLSLTADGFFMESHPKLKPVDAPTRGVYLAGTCEAPKDIKDSVTQAGAAAARAQTILNASEIALEAITAHVQPENCMYCGKCEPVCPYNAIRGSDSKAEIAPHVIEASCMGCGTCAAECDFDAIVTRHFTNEQLDAQIDAVLENDPQSRMFAFACNWCSYAGGDTAGVGRMQYPASSVLVRTMCSGRVSPAMMLRAFASGAPIVLVSGCHFADCHYIDANRQTVKRVEKMWTLLEKNGIRPERLQLEWISAAEGQKFAKVMRELEEMRAQVTPAEIERSIAVAKKELQAMEVRRKKALAKRQQRRAAVQLRAEARA
jgi:heterodisulfide reductase subunit A